MSALAIYGVAVPFEESNSRSSILRRACHPLVCSAPEFLIHRVSESRVFVQEFQEYPTLGKIIASVSRPCIRGTFGNYLLAFHVLLMSGSYAFRNDFRGEFGCVIIETRVERSVSFM